MSIAVCGYDDFFQAAALVKCPVPNACYAVGDGDVRKAATFTKHLVPDARYIVRNDDAS